MTTIATEIKHIESIENSFEVLNVIKVDLDSILIEEFNLGLPTDINNGF